MNKIMNKKNIKEFIIINLGIFLTALGTVLFKNPNNFVFGGVSGLSLILSDSIHKLSFAVIMAILNTVLLLIGYMFLGKSFGLKTIYASYAFSVYAELIHYFFPLAAPLTNQKFMELFYAVFLPGIGSALLFNCGASSGGTDIIAKIICKYFKSVKVSYALLFTDITIVIWGGFVFGVQAFLFAVIGVLMKSFVLDMILENLNVNKVVVIITEHPEKIKDYICNVLERGATVHLAQGAYTVHDKQVITTVLNRKEAFKLQKYLKSIDADAFITITNSSRIIGKGFNYSI